MRLIDDTWKGLQREALPAPRIPEFLKNEKPPPPTQLSAQYPGRQVHAASHQDSQAILLALKSDA